MVGSSLVLSPVVAHCVGASHRPLDGSANARQGAKHSRTQRVVRLLAPVVGRLADLPCTLGNRGLFGQAVTLIVRGIPKLLLVEALEAMVFQQLLTHLHLSLFADEFEYSDATV